MNNESVNFLATGLERRRLRAQVSIARLCLIAQVDPRTYNFFLRGRTRSLRRSTIARIEAALEALETVATGGLADKINEILQAPAVRRWLGAPAAPAVLPQEAVASLFRQAFAAFAAERRRISVIEALNTDFARQRPKNRRWMEAARCRRLAMYLVVTGHNIRAAELARALGISRQAVGQAVTAIEEARDRPQIDRLIDRVAARLIGN